MADRPILFSAPMVRALLAGTKTQTRRVIEPTQKDIGAGQIMLFEGPRFGGRAYRFCLPFAVGDRLYVREEYYHYGHWEPVIAGRTKGGQQKWYFTGVDQMVIFEQPAEFLTSRSKVFPGLDRWYKRLGRFMPRRYSRLTLTVTDVRVERLQDISREDAIAEGLTHQPGVIEPDWWVLPEPLHQGAWLSPVAAYRFLWNEINGAGAWDANPWVVAVSFDVREGNIDA